MSPKEKKLNTIESTVEKIRLRYGQGILRTIGKTETR